MPCGRPHQRWLDKAGSPKQVSSPLLNVVSYSTIYALPLDLALQSAKKTVYTFSSGASSSERSVLEPKQQ